MQPEKVGNLCKIVRVGHVRGVNDFVTADSVHVAIGEQCGERRARKSTARQWHPTIGLQACSFSADCFFERVGSQYPRM